MSASPVCPCSENPDTIQDSRDDVPQIDVDMEGDETTDEENLKIRNGSDSDDAYSTEDKQFRQSGRDRV